MEAEAVPHVAVTESAVSAVRSSVAVAGAVCPPAVNAASVGEPAVPVWRVTSPFAMTVPVEPFERVVISSSMSNSALVTDDGVVIAAVVATTVPVTPPHRTLKVRVGVPVVLYLPKTLSRRVRPSCR